MSVEINQTQNEDFIGMNLSRFKETCAFASNDVLYTSLNNRSDKKQYGWSYDEADEITEQITINLMKEIWNIPLDE